MPPEGDKNISQEDDLQFKKAIKLRDKGKFQEALNILEKLLPKHPKRPALLVLLADTHWEIGNFESAVDFFRSATAIRPRTEFVSLGLFHCLRDMGKQEEALDEAKRFMAIKDSKEYKGIIRAINEKATEK